MILFVASCAVEARAERTEQADDVAVAWTVTPTTGRFARSFVAALENGGETIVLGIDGKMLDTPN